MKRKGLLILFLLIVLMTIVFGFGRRAYVYRYSPVILRDTVVKVYPESGKDKDSIARYEAFLNELQKGGIIESAQEMLAYAKDYDRVGAKVGSYRLQVGSTYRQVLNQLFYGNQTPVALTFNNIRTLERLAGRMARYTLADSSDFIEVFNDEVFIDSLGFTKETLPGMFLPNTYEIYWTDAPKDLMLRFKSEYDRFWTNDRISKAKHLNLSRNEVSTIASIVIEETKTKEEMSTVAGVYINRIKEGMPLQADPTIKFALKDFGLKRILNKHLDVDSPYNTYKNQGLPPGPITIPDSYVIDAVLDYEGHDYMYFCAKSDFSGAHAFARNLSEHNKNAAAYHKELNRRKIK